MKKISQTSHVGTAIGTVSSFLNGLLFVSVVLLYVFASRRSRRKRPLSAAGVQQ